MAPHGVELPLDAQGLGQEDRELGRRARGVVAVGHDEEGPGDLLGAAPGLGDLGDGGVAPRGALVEQAGDEPQRKREDDGEGEDADELGDDGMFSEEVHGREVGPGG